MGSGAFGFFSADVEYSFFSCTFSKWNILLTLRRMRGAPAASSPIRRKHARFFHLLLFSLRRAELPGAAPRRSSLATARPGSRRSRISPSRLHLAAPLLAFISCMPIAAR